MSEDEIIQMAVECGIIPWTKHEYIGNKRFTATDDGLDGDAASLVQFFQMAVAHEREACAQRLDAVGCDHCATNIRARGNK